MSKSLDFYEPLMKEKKKHHHLKDNGYDHETSKKIADQMEDFLHDVSMMIIIMNKPYSKIKKAKKVIKQTIKDLREGREDKVFDEEAYEEYMRSYNRG